MNQILAFATAVALACGMAASAFAQDVAGFVFRWPIAGLAAAESNPAVRFAGLPSGLVLSTSWTEAEWSEAVSTFESATGWTDVRVTGTVGIEPSHYAEDGTLIGDNVSAVRFEGFNDNRGAVRVCLSFAGEVPLVGGGDFRPAATVDAVSTGPERGETPCPGLTPGAVSVHVHVPAGSGPWRPGPKSETFEPVPAPDEG